MAIKISDIRKISDIQNEFSKTFPFLKLEFFSKPDGKKGSVEKIIAVDSSKKIRDCRQNHKKEHVTIEPKQTVAELEKAFLDYYGLSIQVFRKSGKMWLQSTITDDWTLKEQNEHGEALCNLISD